MKINIGTFNLIKGIAIFNVVFVHCAKRFPLESFSFLFPLYIILAMSYWAIMPAFFIINGYGHKKKTVGKMLRKSYTELLLPYFFATFATIVFYNIFHWKMYDSHALAQITGQKIISLFLCTEVAETLWFFVAMFIAQNILNLIIKVNSQLIQVSLVGLCIFLAIVLRLINFEYFRLIAGLAGVGFLYIGYYLKEKDILVNYIHSKMIYIILIPIWLLQVISLWGEKDGLFTFMMSTGQFSILGYIAAACSGILFVFGGVLFSKINFRVMNWLKSLGMYSYWIFIVHSIEYLSVPWHDMWNENPSIYLASLIELGLRIAIIIMGCAVLKKISQLKYLRKSGKNEKKRNNERADS